MATKETEQQILRELGFSDPFGGGAAQNWLNADPTRRKMFDERVQARDAGYTGPFGGGAYYNWATNAGNTYGMGGVAPVGVVEPFNDYQKAGITSLATPFNNPFASGTQQAFNSVLANSPDIKGMFSQGQNLYNQAEQSFNNASNATANGIRGFTGNDLQNGINMYMNPYTQKVIDASVAQINNQGDQARAAILGRLAGKGSSSFGTTSEGVQLSELAKNTLNQVGNTSATLNYQGYNDAVNNTLNQFNQDRNNSLQGAGLYNSIGNSQASAGQNQISNGFTGQSQLAQLAGIGGGLGSGAMTMNNQGALNQINAGNLIQNQNQKLLDVVNNERNNMNNFGNTSLSQLAQLLGVFPQTSTSQSSSTSSGSSTGATPAQNNTIGNIAGGLMTLGGTLTNNASKPVNIGNAMPWLTI